VPSRTTARLRANFRFRRFMHDGSIPTLEEVADYYDRGGNANPNG